MTEEGLEGDRGSYVTWGPWTHSDAAVAADAIGAVARCGQGLILNVPRCTHTHTCTYRDSPHTHTPRIHSGTFRAHLRTLISKVASVRD